MPKKVTRKAPVKAPKKGVAKATKKSATKTGKTAKKTSRMRPASTIFAMTFGKIYPLYVQKAERKERTKQEVDQILRWLTGYDQKGLVRQIRGEKDLQSFFAEAPAMHPNCSMVQGVVCGVRIEEIEDPLMRKIRIMDKLIDELAQGRAMAKILRQ